jgi:hypothetical protein
MIKEFLDEIEKFKDLIKDIDRPVEDNAEELYNLLNKFLDSPELGENIATTLVELASYLPKDVQKIRAKRIDVERDHYDKDIQELDQLCTSLGKNILSFVYGNEIKRLKDSLMRPQGAGEYKKQKSPSSAIELESETGRKAGNSGEPLHNDSNPALEPRLILELADKFVSPEDSPARRIAVADEIYKWAVRGRADVSLGLQRA